MTAPACPRAALDAAMTEKALQDAIIQAARALNYLVYHATDSRKNEPGFPDLIIVGHGLLCAWELKTERGCLRQGRFTQNKRWLPGQQEWIDAFYHVDEIHAMVIRPAQLDDALEKLQNAYERSVQP